VSDEPPEFDARNCLACGGSGAVCPCGGPPCQVPASYGCGLEERCPICGQEPVDQDDLDAIAVPDKEG
jgi:hypothetical protein